MAARATGHLSREQRALIEEAISNGDFRNFEDFEDFALRQAVSQLSLRKLQDESRRRRHSPQRILEEARAVRRAVAKKYEA
jgi:hypothetical protein